MNAFAIICAMALPVVCLGQTPPPKGACSSPSYRQMDFWIGRWDVFDSTGKKKLGQNVITPILKGCALHEDWASAGGTSGRSFSAYDSVTRRWHQTWVDEAGNVWKIDGGMSGRGMVMERREPDARNSGSSIIHRWTWTPAGRDALRQRYELSRDSGRTWVVDFDGRYVRRK